MRSCPLCKHHQAKKVRTIKGYDLLQCEDCFFVFSDIEKQENEKTNAGYDDKAVDSYEYIQDMYDRKWMEEIAKKFTKKKGAGKILDVGCGNGLLLSFFKRYGWDCYGVDLSPWSERFARKYGFKLYSGKIEDLDLEKDYFDLVTSTSTLEHIYNPVPHLTRIIELTKPDGHGYFSGIPNYGSLAIRLGYSNFICNHPPGHVNYFTPKTICKAFDFVGKRTKKINVSTYGIPELYRLKRFFVRNRKNKMASSIKMKKSESNNKISDEIVTNLVIKLNYHLGRPFSIGDKIEFVIKK